MNKAMMHHLSTTLSSAALAALFLNYLWALESVKNPVLFGEDRSCRAMYAVVRILAFTHRCKALEGSEQRLGMVWYILQGAFWTPGGTQT